LIAALLAVAFVMESTPSANAQAGGGMSRKMSGQAFMHNGGRALEYGQADEYLKLDKDGKPIYKPGTEPKEKQNVTVYEDENDEVSDSEPVHDGEVTIVATVAVPHMKKCLTQVTAYPYPMKPPPVKVKVKLLPDKDKPLKQMMLSTGYFSRASLDVPYPPGGWRWQYAFQKAIKNSNMSLPHSIFEHYTWADRMLPFIKAQTKIYNSFERDRVAAYNNALQEFNDTRTEVEDVAMQRNMTPVPMKRVFLKSGKAGLHYAGNLKSGKWWILATHRVPGLKYFWLLPTEVGDKKERIVLNEGNAIYIEGGW
jgi:hypothetical protein